MYTFKLYDKDLNNLVNIKLSYFAIEPGRKSISIRFMCGATSYFVDRLNECFKKEDSFSEFNSEYLSFNVYDNENNLIAKGIDAKVIFADTGLDCWSARLYVESFSSKKYVWSKLVK